MAEGLDDWVIPTRASAPVDDWVVPTRAREPVDDWVVPGRTQAPGTPEGGPGGSLFDPEEEERKRRAREVQPEAEGMLATGLRSFAHEAPAVAAGAAGAYAGAGVGTAIAPGVGTLVGGVGGALAGGFGGGAAAETGLKALGFDDSTQRAINEKTNPWSSAIGQGLAQVLGFGAGAASTAARVGGAAIGGGIEAGSQIYQGEFDPARLATQAAAGAVFTKPYGWGSRLEAQGAALGERFRPKVEPHGSAGPESSVGIAEQATPATRAENQTGDPQNKVTRSERDYPAAGTEPVAPGGGVHVGDVDPTLKAALDAKTADMAPPPVEAPPAAEPQRPPMTAPAQDVRVTPETAAPPAEAPIAPGLVDALRQSKRTVRMGEFGSNVVDDPHAVDILKSQPETLAKVETALADYGITGLQPLGGGVQFAVLGSGDKVVRLNTYGLPKAYDIPEYHKPIAQEQIGRVSVEVLPKLDTANITEADVSRMKQQLARRGLQWGDAATDNLGRDKDGTLKIIDGSITKNGVEVGAAEIPSLTKEAQPAPMTAPAEGARVTPEMAAPATPREAIEQRAPDTTVGGALRETAAARRQDVLRGPEPGGVGVEAPIETPIGGGGAEGPPGGPRGPPPPGEPPPGPPPGGPPPTGGNAQQSILARIAAASPASWRDKIPTNMAEAKTAWRQVYTAAKDELDPLAQFTNKLSQGRSLAAEEDPYKLARLTKGSFGRVEQMLNHGTFDFETGQTNGKSLRDVVAPVKDNMDGFTAYAAAKRAIELEGRGVKTGMPLPEANSVVAQGARQYEPVFRELVDYQNRALDYLQKSGVRSADDVARMRAVNKEFVPFYRLMDSGTELGQQVGAGLKVRNPIQAIKGSEREILNPIESIIKNTHAYVALAERNRALLALEKLAAVHPQGDQLMQRVIERHPVKVTPDEINKFMQEQELPGQTAEAMTIFRPNAFRPAPDQIRLFKDGKSQIYKVDPAIAESVNSLDRDSINTLTRILGAPARLLRAGATLSPEFIVRNPIRDQFSAMVNSKYGYVPVYDMVKGLGSLWNKDQVYQQWLKSGGSNAAMVSLDRKLIGLQPTDLAGKVKNVIKSPIEALRAASELMENSTRLGEFRRAIEQGASPAEAAYSSREVTMDFARMGAKTKALNAIIPFFNAQIEGVDRAARAFKDNPTNFLTKVGLGITLPSTLLWFANKDDPRYRELPQWEKDLFWIVPTDHWTGMTKDQAAGVGDAHKRQLPDGTWQRNDGTIYRIPKPFELGALFGSVPERILDSFFTAHPNSFKDLHKTLWQTLTPNFMPQAATPVIEQFANRSMFLDRPLVPKSLEKVQPKYQSTGYTSEVAKTIGGMISSFNKDTSFASPVVIDNYIRQWTGGLGAHAVNILDTGLRATGVAPDKIQPESTAADIPLLKAFAARFPAGSAQSVQDFYTTYDERKSAKATDTYLRKSGRDSERAGGPIQVAEGIHKALGNQQKFIRNVYSDMSMSPAEKRQLIDVTYLQMIETARRGNQILNR